MEWYYADASNQQVSFQEEEFKTLIDRGLIGSETLVWNTTMPDWRKASQAQPLLFRSQAPALTQIPPSNYYQAQQQPQDGLGITSMVCGILSILMLCGVGPFAIFGAIPAIICGHMSRKNMLQMSPPGNTGFSMAGLIMGYIGTAISVIMGVILVVVFVTAIGAEATKDLVPTE